MFDRLSAFDLVAGLLLHRSYSSPVPEGDGENSLGVSFCIRGNCYPAFLGIIPSIEKANERYVAAAVPKAQY